MTVILTAKEVTIRMEGEAKRRGDAYERLQNELLAPLMKVALAQVEEADGLHRGS